MGFLLDTLWAFHTDCIGPVPVSVLNRVPLLHPRWLSQYDPVAIRHNEDLVQNELMLRSRRAAM